MHIQLINQPLLDALFSDVCPIKLTDLPRAAFFAISIPSSIPFVARVNFVVPQGTAFGALGDDKERNLHEKAPAPCSRDIVLPPSSHDGAICLTPSSKYLASSFAKLKVCGAAAENLLGVLPLKYQSKILPGLPFVSAMNLPSEQVIFQMTLDFVTNLISFIPIEFFLISKTILNTASFSRKPEIFVSSWSGPDDESFIPVR